RRPGRARAPPAPRAPGPGRGGGGGGAGPPGRPAAPGAPPRDGTYELSCHPAAGTHPDVTGACGAVDRNTKWGRDAFAPVAPDSACTMLYGGPATARVTGTWAGRPVDATYNRSNGCEIGRWNRMVPLLPDLGSRTSAGVHSRFMAESPVP
ncbi:SSI family serine proteinase inhibitor, partial [Streptomyces sp. NPDC058964]|uniref:SSI family serine proteinase inhibitor n=1 Tax=Streptomyces sp. NPDC058964 TaxID=3346681 RepID=UPI003673941B